MSAISSLPAREALSLLYRSAVDAARGDLVLRNGSRCEGDLWIYEGRGGRLQIPLPTRTSNGRVIVAGVGKAAASMARGVERVLGNRIDTGAVIVKQGHAEALDRIRVLEADHPIPTEASLAATRTLVRLLESTTEADTVFFLLTGGASSLLCMPADRISFADKIEAHRLLVNSGATIDEINAVRKRMSAVKGGKLRSRSPARVFCTLAISDVLGDDPATIGSGPTFADARTDADALAVIERHGLLQRFPLRVLQYLQRSESHPGDVEKNGRVSEYRVIASIGTAIDACARRAREQGFEVRVLTDRMAGHTHAAASGFAQAARESAEQRLAGDRPLLLIAGGETTLAVTGPGKGGRNQEFAVVAADHLQGLQNVTLLAAGTDGTDGPTDAAGAYADGSSVARVRSLGLDVNDHLRRNDTYTMLAALGDLFKPGPTGTNVMDLVLALVR